MAEDGKVVYKIEGDNSQALKALDEFEAAAKSSVEKIEEAGNKTATAYEKLTQQIKSQESALNSAVSEYKNIILEQGANFESTQNLQAKLGALNSELAESEKRLSDVDEATEKATGSFNKTSNSIEKIAKAIGSAFVVKQVIEFGKAAVGVASDLNEVQNVVDTTFGTEGAIRINEWARNAAEAFGESELQAKQFTSTLGAMFKSMGVGQADMEEMSMSLAGLAGDMASFYNLDPSEAFEKLRSGISGETEPLKQLGINMSVVNLEAFAMSEGITKAYQEMTQAEQATLRYQYIMSATADAQGDFTNTSDSLANQQRILQLEIQTLAAEIGQDLMPIAEEIISTARDGVQWVRENKDALEVLAGTLGAATAAYAAWKAMIKAEELYDSVTKSIKGITSALSGAEAAGGLTAALGTTGTAASGFGSTLLGALGPAGWATVAAVAGIGSIIAVVAELKSAQEEAIVSQFEYIDSLYTLADYNANGLLDHVTGKIDYKTAEEMQKNGTFKRDNTKLGPAPGRTFTKISDIANEKWKNDFWGTLGETVSYKFGRHQSGEDFVMADWTPAYLDYGERVLTAAENAKYTAMGGVDGMERAASGGSSGGFSAPSKMELGFKVFPREMAHAITPYIIKELQAQGKWEDVR